MLRLAEQRLDKTARKGILSHGNQCRASASAVDGVTWIRVA